MAAFCDRFESCADAGFPAGMMAGMFCCHLPRHRQHRRLAAARIRVSPASLTNWVLVSASPLAPIHDSQFRSVLESGPVAMDETSIKNGSGRGGCVRLGSGRW